jgi:hypothetical protein
MNVLDTLTRAGLSVEIDGDLLLVQPKHLLTDELRTIIRDNKAAVIAHLNDWAADTGANPHWRWQVVFTDGSACIAAFTPTATWPEVVEFFPHAVSGHPLPEPKNEKEKS